MKHHDAVKNLRPIAWLDGNKAAPWMISQGEGRRITLYASPQIMSYMLYDLASMQKHKTFLVCCTWSPEDAQYYEVVEDNIVTSAVLQV